MKTEKAQEDQGGSAAASSAVAAAVTHTAVQGVPWWGGVSHQAVLQNAAASSSPTASSLHLEHPAAIITSMAPMGFTLPPPAQQAAALPEGGLNGEVQPLMGAPAGMPTGVREYAHPQTQLELGHTLASAAYPYADPYFGGMIAAYGTHAMVGMYPHMLGIHQSRMPLPSEITEEEPVYVNAKQYNGIMRRRQSRAKAESENKLVKARKPYLHESRHLHAIRRERGCGGRFLNKKDSKNAGRTDRGFKGCGKQEAQGMEGPMSGRFIPGRLDQGGYCHAAIVQGDSTRTLHEPVLHSRMNDDTNSGKSGGVIANSTQQRVMAMQ
ncbi:hypothetical protein GOP47_0016356 [Adiantum capillus-veneris]|uniref:Nuclear transcription factor Y subunit n=1 Tax=Adiantum capillus-veneris TaxID=13818 RepID=A0A9D4UIK4_ADICA|nr:hypothetical protein GOP47_0016356 [Adiantum capillus-veneris]